MTIQYLRCLATVCFFAFPPAVVIRSSIALERTAYIPKNCGSIVLGSLDDCHTAAASRRSGEHVSQSDHVDGRVIAGNAGNAAKSFDSLTRGLAHPSSPIESVTLL
jgi:hypothetical protein